MCACDTEIEKGWRKKEKREVIRFKNSFFSVFLHGCHVPVVEVLCVSLCYVIYYSVLHTAIHCYEGVEQREISVNYC